MIDLAAASAASRHQVQSLMSDLHRFDPYLRFASPNEEEAYRRREAERRAYIEEQHARGTPEGDLNANAAALGQMVDAEAHGAGNAPGFAARRDAIAGSYERLRTDIRRIGGSTPDADAMLARDVRQTLRREGRSDREIDALFAAHGGDPLAVIQADPGIAHGQTTTAAVETPTHPAPDELADAMAALRAAGVAPAPATSELSPTAGTPQLAARVATGRA